MSALGILGIASVIMFEYHEACIISIIIFIKILYTYVIYSRLCEYEVNALVSLLYILNLYLLLKYISM